MKTQAIIRALLGLNGVVLTGIGVMLVSDPHALFALNGVVLTPDANLLSEVRAPGGALALAGAFILAAACLRTGLKAASGLSALILLGWALGRSVSMVMDGMPDAGLLTAFAIEAGLGFASLWATGKLGRSNSLEAEPEPA